MNYALVTGKKEKKPLKFNNMENIMNVATVDGIKEVYYHKVISNITLLDKIANAGHRYLKDLKVNFSNAMSFETLSKKESYLLALAVAVNDKHKIFTEAFEDLARQEGATDVELAEIFACVSLLNTNNVFYRFRHFTKKDFYTNTSAGIKMSIMANPVLGKEFFELVSLAVSALNGCELCVSAHEDSLIKIGTSEQRIFDAVRCCAVVKGFATIG
jgi:lipoyl-dependent peroxiredoxin subunit D